ncbi:MAG TPA: DNA-processing protein DprA [candidate division Zixibacteria bacterium]|nr:DNA-processing protein DprA [candidate division Zixibacteria bacterium]
MNTVVTPDLMALFLLATKLHLGPKVIAALIAACGAPSEIIEAGPETIAEIAMLDDDQRDQLTEILADGAALHEELTYITGKGIGLVGIHEEQYPPRLLRLGDPPPLLFVCGQLPDPDKTAIAVVGSHHADAIGIAEAVNWGKGLVARDVVVVSGLARGIDGGAHTGALAGNGTTVAVLGSGFDNIYPPEHRALAEEVTTQGALISEYPPSAPLTKARLVSRNRLIVGLCDAVVVVRVSETTKGSMEAIKRARDIAVPVFLVATDAGEASRRAIAEGAIPILPEPDYDLVLNYL